MKTDGDAGVSLCLTLVPRGWLTRPGIVGLVMIAVFAVPSPGNAADYYVNTTADTADEFCTSAPILPFNCSLRDAVMQANNNPGKDTIHLEAAVYNLTIPLANAPDAESGPLVILDDVDIVGAGAHDTIIHSTTFDVVFNARDHDYIEDGHPLLQLFDLTISGGDTGVRADSAAAYLWRCVVEKNQRSNGGIYGGDSTILVVDSVVRENIHGDEGGGINVDGGSLWVLRSTIADNLAHDDGGAVSCTNASVTFTNATVTGNSLFDPHERSTGGFFGAGCDVLITGSTFAGNLPNDLEPYFLDPGTVTVRNSYIGSQCLVGTASRVTSEGGNVGAPTCGLFHASDIDFAAGTGILLPLGDYGGHTPTMPPWAAGYPLVDNPDADNWCLGDDQRGILRPQDAHCDTGAVERIPADLAFIFTDGFESGDTSLWTTAVP